MRKAFEGVAPLPHTIARNYLNVKRYSIIQTNDLNEKSHLHRQHFRIIRLCIGSNKFWTVQRYEEYLKLASFYRKKFRNCSDFPKIIFIFAAKLLKYSFKNTFYMLYGLIAVCAILVGILYLVFKDQKHKNKLPNSKFERIGAAAVAIQQMFISKGYSENKNDRCIWNNISFVIAFLIDQKICSIIDKVRLELEFKHTYDDEDESFTCGVWINEGVSFYRKEIQKIFTVKNTLPDVIVYNLLNPNVDKVSFKDLPLFGVNVLVASDCWVSILHIMDTFFFNDKNLKDLPLGCKTYE